MKRMMVYLLALAMVGLPLFAAQDKKEADRLDNCGTVLKEILDVPDDIPQNLLDKAECVIIYPSVLKAAFGIGASYGRGVMTCRGGHRRHDARRSFVLLSRARTVRWNFTRRLDGAARQRRQRSRLRSKDAR